MAMAPLNFVVATWLLSCLFQLDSLPSVLPPSPASSPVLSIPELRDLARDRLYQMEIKSKLLGSLMSKYFGTYLSLEMVYRGPCQRVDASGRPHLLLRGWGMEV